MQLLNWIASKRVRATEFASFACLVLLYMLTHTVALAADQPSAQSLFPPFGATGLQTPAHDVTLTGTVKRLVTDHTAGTPTGLQVVVEGPQGPFTASLGTNLSHEVQQSLSQGVPVQISGMMRTVNGTQYLLARTLTIANKQIIVRNENGVLVHSSQRPRTSVNNSGLYRSAK